MTETQKNVILAGKRPVFRPLTITDQRLNKLKEVREKEFLTKRQLNPNDETIKREPLFVPKTGEFVVLPDKHAIVLGDGETDIVDLEHLVSTVDDNAMKKIEDIYLNLSAADALLRYQSEINERNDHILNTNTMLLYLNFIILIITMICVIIF